MKTKQLQPLKKTIYNIITKNGKVVLTEVGKSKEEGDAIVLNVYKKEDIKSACEFYLRYKDKPELLKKEFPTSLKVGKKEFGAEDELNNFLRIIKEKITFLQGFEIEIFKQKYNDWLFKLAFKDVLENEN